MELCCTDFEAFEVWEEHGDREGLSSRFYEYFLSGADRSIQTLFDATQ